MIRLLHLVPLSVLVGLFLIGCAPEESVRASENMPVAAWLPLKIDGVTIEAQIAITASEQARGLMHRESLGEDRGMLFPYPTPRPLSFWMKNTLIPLDIGFFDQNGVLREIHAMYPQDLRSVRSRRDDLSYALEMNQGWFRKNGIRPGAQLDPATLSQALRARGANPADYRLPPH